MAIKNYHQQVWDLRKQIVQDIEEIVRKNGNHITIPFYYDEDEIDEDIKTLIDDEIYDVRPSEGINTHIEIVNHCGYIQQIDVVALAYRLGDVEVISKESRCHCISEVSRMSDLAELYEIVATKYGTN